MSGTGNVGSEATTEMPANDGTPWIGVHVLTEFIFCPRAGLIAFEEARTDPGQELGGVPRLDYLPDFEEQIIEAALQEIWGRIWAMLTWTPPVALVVGVAGSVWDWRLWLILIPLGVWLVRSLVRQLRNVLELSRRLRAAREAAPSEPDPNSTQLQDVNWWSLLKAGFTPVEYEEPHEDMDVNLAGKPWRVLHKGSVRIPVFRKRRGKEQLYPQHFARMAAYCHLIETAEGGSAPYGVVLFGDGYGGVTVPNTRENREAFQKALRGARGVIEAVQAEQLVPEVPGQARACHDCHRGWPRVYRKGMTDTRLDDRPLPPYCTRAEDRRLYHSVCGDRFRWVPPHDRAAEKGLC